MSSLARIGLHLRGSELHWSPPIIGNTGAGRVGARALGRMWGGTAKTKDFSPDGKLLVAHSRREDTIHVWDAATGKELLRRLSPDSTPYSFAFSPDGRQVAAGMNDGTILLWDVSQVSPR
jgi:WD40 repeat protein